MPVAKLRVLTCTTPFTGSEDDLVFEIRLDGATQREPYVLRETMSAGDTWSIQRSFQFSNQAEVTLRTQSNQTPNKAGTATVGSTTSQTVTFDKHGANYELTVGLGQTSEDPVKWAIDKFESSIKNSVWIGLGPKPGHISRLRALTADSPQVRGLPIGPFWLNQNGTNTCGPAGVGFTLAYRFPRRFVEIARSLYEQGAFLGANDIHEAVSALRQNPLPARVREMTYDSNTNWNTVWEGLSMHPFDWMVLAGIGDIQDAFSIQRSGEVPDAQAWLKDVLGYSTIWTVEPQVYNVLIANTSLPWAREDDVESMFHSAHNAVKAGGIAYLLVEAVEFWQQWETDRDYQRALRAEVFGPTYSHLVTLADSSWGGEDGTHEMVVHDNGMLRHRNVTADDLENWLAIVVTGEP